MLKLRKYQLIYIIYFICLTSFIFLNCQEISSQELAAASTIFILFDINAVFKSSGQFKRIVICFLVYCTLQMFLSYFRYGQSWSDLIYICGELISLLLYLYFTGAKNNEKNGHDWYLLTERMYKVFMLVMYLEIGLSYLGVRLLDSTVYRYRDKFIRITIGDYIIAIGTLLLWGKIISKGNDGEKSRIKDVLFVFFGVVYIILVSQTRMMILALILALGLSYLITKKNKSKKAIVVIVSGLFFIVLWCTPFFQNYFNNNFAGLISGEDTSMIPRLKGIIHYWNYTLQRPLLGWGYALETAESNGAYNLYKMFRGEWGNLYTNDVGIFSYMMVYGLIGTLLYFFLIRKMLKIAIAERKYEPHKMAVAIFVVITSFSLILFDTLRQSYIVLVLMCFEMSVHKNITERG